MARIFALFALLLLAGSPLLLARQAAETPDEAFAIRAEPVPLDAADPTRRRIGALVYRGGWALTSDDDRFGGLSGLAIDGDGFLAVGDAGGLFRFALDDAGQVTRAAIGRLVQGPEPEDGGEPEKKDRDAESIALDSRSGRFWVGFERANAVWRYDAAGPRAEAHAEPAAMEDWPNNGGAEAMVRLPDGRFILLSEEGRGPAGSREGFVFDGDPAAGAAASIRFGYRPPAGYAVTDAALLDARRLLVLNRRFSLMEGVSVIVTLVDLADLRADAVLEGRSLARLDPPLTVDNMEALAVTHEGDRTIVWMASDDNFNPLQRTLLLKFELVEAP